MSSSTDGIDVSVIVLNYNGRRWLEGCLTATFGQMDGRQELILVDNASTDDSVELRAGALSRDAIARARGEFRVCARQQHGRADCAWALSRIPEQRHDSSTWMVERPESALRPRSIGRCHDIPDRVSPRSVGHR